MNLGFTPCDSAAKSSYLRTSDLVPRTHAWNRWYLLGCTIGLNFFLSLQSLSTQPVWGARLVSRLFNNCSLSSPLSLWRCLLGWEEVLFIILFPQNSSSTSSQDIGWEWRVHSSPGGTTQRHLSRQMHQPQSMNIYFPVCLFIQIRDIIKLMVNFPGY